MDTVQPRSFGPDVELGFWQGWEKSWMAL